MNKKLENRRATSNHNGQGLSVSSPTNNAFVGASQSMEGQQM